MSEPFVTIVTPTFKRDSLLLRAAKSVVAQRGVRIEHVIVGNTCPLLPGLEPALREINPGVKILHMPRWDSPMAAFTPALIARARNAGINAASGDYVAQLDSDNTLDPDHTASLAACIEAVPGRLVATCGRKFFYSDGRPHDLPYHPWGQTLEEAAATWKRFEKAGIYKAGSNRASERLTPETWPCGVDAGEIMLRREAHMDNLFPTHFTPEEIRGDLGEDTKLAWRLYHAGHDIGFTGRHTLNFYLGGEFTAQLENLLIPPGN